mmetsp:Transcript_17514/g.42741  ORF Transcript_17514/g.42741 Transcript_17514/m.42741 type:complete len:103 (+) Transcript_17514:1972-2280(+)
MSRSTEQALHQALEGSRELRELLDFVDAENGVLQEVNDGNMQRYDGMRSRILEKDAAIEEAQSEVELQRQEIQELKSALDKASAQKDKVSTALASMTWRTRP